MSIDDAVAQLAADPALVARTIELVVESGFAQAETPAGMEGRKKWAILIAGRLAELLGRVPQPAEVVRVAHALADAMKMHRDRGVN